MRIHRLSERDCYEHLTQTGFGRLACAQDNQPYVVPIYFGVGDRDLYSFALPGQKVRWMRANPKVCLETDAIGASNDWTSVVVIGRYEELGDASEFQRARTFTLRLLQRRAMWWEPGAVSPEGHDGDGGYVPIVYRIAVDSVSGYRGIPAGDNATTDVASRKDEPSP